jgi:hypothetical protein
LPRGVTFRSELLGCVLGSHGLGSHLVVPPTGNPPIGLGNRSQPNWDEGPTQLGPQNPVNKAIFTWFCFLLRDFTCFLKLLLKFHIIIKIYLYRYYYNSAKCLNIALNVGFRMRLKIRLWASYSFPYFQPVLLLLLLACRLRKLLSSRIQCVKK